MNFSQNLITGIRMLILAQQFNNIMFLDWPPYDSLVFSLVVTK